MCSYVTLFQAHRIRLLKCFKEFHVLQKRPMRVDSNTAAPCKEYVANGTHIHMRMCHCITPCVIDAYVVGPRALF